MKREKFESLVNNTTDKLRKVLFKKSSDYATVDVLSNFKRLSGAAKSLNINVQTPFGYAIFMCLMKLDRINNLVINKKEPKNESIEDSFLDDLGYTFLALALYAESVDNEESS